MKSVDATPSCPGIFSTRHILNISRELLQHDPQLKFIAKAIEKKIKNELAKMLDSDREKYEAF